MQAEQLEKKSLRWKAISHQFGEYRKQTLELPWLTGHGAKMVVLG